MIAAITYSGSIVSLDSDFIWYPEFSFNGFLLTFAYKGRYVRYCDSDDIREAEGIGDYYYSDSYADYVKNRISLDELVKKHRFEHFDYIFEEPSVGDPPIKIYTKKLYISEDGFDDLFYSRIYRWDFIEDEEIYFRDSQLNPVIKVPQRALDESLEPFPDEIPITLVQTFYNNNKYLINEFPTAKLTVARYLNSICWNMQRIVEDIFPLFASDSVFNSYINRQKEDWETELIMEEINYGLLSSYYNGLSDFYRYASLYRVNLNTMTAIEKLHFLTLALGARAISMIPINDRFKILKLLIDKYLSSVDKVPVEEKIVIKIVQSFSYNEQSDRDEFLTRLVNPEFNGDGEKGKTIYEVLYDRMSTAWEVTRSLIALVNWAFNATWKPTDTRGMFVKSIYGLWLRSQYNPYDYDTFGLKNNTIGLKKRIDGVMNFQTNDIDDDLPINYSTSRPSNIKYFYTDQPAYEIQYFSGANELDAQTYYAITEIEAAPIMFDYRSSEEYGFYIDNAKFAFRSDHIIAYHNVPTHITTSYQKCKYNDFSAVFAGRYHMFQPVHLRSDSVETAEPMLITEGDNINFNGTNINSLVPIFFLKYIDDLGSSKNIQTFLGYAVDVVSTFVPLTNLTKLRHIRHLTRFGKAALVIETVQIAASIINFLLGFIDSCNAENTFCKRLRTVLFYLELSSLGTDTFVMQKARKSAKDTVEEAIENGWPLDMLDEIPNTGGLTPKMKLEELAGNFTKIRNKFIDNAKDILKADLSAEPLDFISRYSDEELEEIFELALQKGISVEESAGVVHQACKKRNEGYDYKASIAELGERMSNIILVKKRGYPLNFSSLESFVDYIENKFIPLLERFGIPKKNVRFGGSCITTTTSFSPGPQDVDWWIVFASKDEEIEFVDKLKQQLEKWADSGLIKQKSKNERILRLETVYKEKGYISHSVIGAPNNSNKIDFWDNILVVDGERKKWIDNYFGETPTDISFKTQDKTPYPSIRRNL